MRVKPHFLRTPAIRHSPTHFPKSKTRPITPILTARFTTGFHQNSGGTGGQITNGVFVNRELITCSTIFLAQRATTDLPRFPNLIAF
jgi:hypothetical protein